MWTLEGVSSAIYTAIATVIAATVGALGMWIKSKVDRKPNEVDLQGLINDGFADLIKAHAADREMLREEVNSLREEVASLRDHIVRLERVLADRDLPIPPRPVVKLRPVKALGG